MLKSKKVLSAKVKPGRNTPAPVERAAGNEPSDFKKILKILREPFTREITTAADWAAFQRWEAIGAKALAKKVDREILSTYYSPGAKKVLRRLYGQGNAKKGQSR